MAPRRPEGRAVADRAADTALRLQCGEWPFCCRPIKFARRGPRPRTAPLAVGQARAASLSPARDTGARIRPLLAVPGGPQRCDHRCTAKAAGRTVRARPRASPLAARPSRRSRAQPRLRTIGWKISLYRTCLSPDRPAAPRNAVLVQIAIRHRTVEAAAVRPLRDKRPASPLTRRNACDRQPPPLPLIAPLKAREKIAWCAMRAAKPARHKRLETALRLPTRPLTVRMTAPRDSPRAAGNSPCRMGGKYTLQISRPAARIACTIAALVARQIAELHSPRVGLK